MVYQLEVLNPEAIALLEGLARLNLIRLQPLSPEAEPWPVLLDRLRSRGAGDTLSEKDIEQEVEAVRSARYEQNS